MGVPNEYLIFDSRPYEEFKTQSFCGFLIKDVVNIFTKSLINSKLEDSVNWAIELLISGHIDKFWTKIFNIIFKNININNPKLPHFIYEANYEKIVENQEYEIKKLIKFCDLEWDSDCLKFNKKNKTPITTVSATQARKAIYKSSINSNSVYSKYLENLFNSLKLDF